MVSLFPHIKATTGGHACAITAVLDGIRAGKWRREVEAVRAADTKTERRQLKMALPYFTASGTFGTRSDAGLLQHSGLVALDLDADQNPGFDIAGAKALAAADAYTYAVFVSAGGQGLCALVRIPADNHGGSFRSLKAYYAQAYGLIVDSLGDVSRPRYVSYDATLFLNEESDTWEDVEAEAVAKAPAPVPARTYRQSSSGAGYGQDAAARAVGKVLGAPDGQKHVMLNKMAYLLGGVVAGGFLGEDEARTELRNAISQREIGDEKGAFQTIDDGLAAGLLKPVLPDALQYAARQQLRHGGTVATVALGISASQGLPADVITPAVQAIADEIARPAVVLETFWDVSDPGQDKPLKISISLGKFRNFLCAAGFRKRKQGVRFQLVHVEGQVVREVLRGDIKDYVRGYIDELPFEFDGIYCSQLEELVLRQNKSLFEEGLTEFLDVLTGVFLHDHRRLARFYFRNGWVEVTPAQGPVLRPYAELPGLVWAETLTARNFTPVALEEAETADFYRFLWNISGKREDRLLAQLQLLGYYLHGYKDPSNPRVGILVDEALGNQGQANGGTGKSLLFRALHQLVPVVTIDGRGYDPRDKNSLQEVKESTRVILFDDWDGRRLGFERLFNMATGTMTVTKLYLGQTSYDYAVSPKIGITTNDMVTGEGGSHERRRYELEIAPHYGANNQPRDEFGRAFFDDWDEAEWTRFDNLLLHGCQLFLAHGLAKVAAVNLNARKLLQSTSGAFVDFMDGLERGIRLYKTDLLQEFRGLEGHDDKFTPDKFGRWITAYGSYSGVDMVQGLEQASSGGIRTSQRYIELRFRLVAGLKL